MNTPRTRVVRRPLPARPGHHLERLISVVAAVTLALGTPIGLTRFGVPFGRVDWDALPNQLRLGDVPRSFLVGIVVSLGWLLWANFVWAFAVEWRAQLAGVQAPTIPIAPGTQYLARRIVSGLLFSVHSFGVMAMPPPDLHTIEPVITMVDDQTNPGTSTGAPAASESSGDPTYLVGRGDTLMSIAAEVLGDEDRWSEIRRLNVGQTRPDGSVMQANETWVMLGQRLALPADAVVPAPTPEATPAVDSPERDPATDHSAPTPSPAQRKGGDVTVVAGDNFWNLAADALETGWDRDVDDAEVAAYHHQVVEENRSALSSVPADPDLIFPGELFVLPPVPADPLAGAGTAPGGPAAAPDPSSRPTPPASNQNPVPSDAAGENNSDASNNGATNSEEDLSIFPSFVDGRDGGTLWAMVPDDRAGKPDDAVTSGDTASETPGDTASETPGDTASETPGGTQAGPTGVGEKANTGASGAAGAHGGASESYRSTLVGTIGAGLLAAAFVRAFRRRRRIQWQQRQPGRMPEPLRASESLALARLEAIADYERLDSTEYTLTTFDVPDSTHVIVDDHEVSVFVPDQPAQMFPAPPAMDDASATFDIEERAGAWVSLGRDETGSDVVVNLSTIEHLWVSVANETANAPSLRADDVVTILATELATSSLNGVRVALLDPVREMSLERLTVVKDEAALASFLESDADGLELAPVIASTIALSDGLLRTAQRRRVPAIVVGFRAASDTAWSCTVRADGTWIEPLQTLVTRDWFDEAAVTALADATLRSERHRDVPGPGSLAYADSDSETTGSEGEGPGSPDQPDVEVMVPVPLVAAVHIVDTPETDDTDAPQVRVLGRVEITGMQRRLESLRAMGLITYLAFHRDGADADRLITWVWPDGSPPTPKAFANVVSRARKSLGTDADGEPYLHKADANGVYRLSKRVTTDFDDLVGILERIGQSGGDESRLEAYEAALSLVRGVPFTGGGAHGFAWTDHGLRAHVDYTIDEAAHACADLAISVGDTDRARWATRIGLQIVPGCEGCYRRRFGAAAADANHAELKAAMAELERVVSDDLGEPEASDSISKDLLDYYESLLTH